MNPLLILFLIIGAGQLGVSDRYSQCDAGGNHCTTFYRQPDGTYSAMPAAPAPYEGRGCLASEHCLDPAPAPLKCGQYEHVELEHYSCVQDRNQQRPAHDCYIDNTPRCAPDLHTVTEKDWQELMERMKRIEEKTVICKYENDTLVCGPKEGKQ